MLETDSSVYFNVHSGSNKDQHNVSLLIVLKIKLCMERVNCSLTQPTVYCSPSGRQPLEPVAVLLPLPSTVRFHLLERIQFIDILISRSAAERKQTNDFFFVPFPTPCWNSSFRQIVCAFEFHLLLSLRLDMPLTRYVIECFERIDEAFEMIFVYLPELIGIGPVPCLSFSCCSIISASRCNPIDLRSNEYRYSI